jgi:putative ABC transport system permease protein
VNGSAWRPGLRIARREAWRSKGRSLLVIALIGLPVLVLGLADICYRTWQLDPHEKLGRTLGAADAEVRWGGGGPVQQSPTSDTAYLTSGTGAAAAPATSVLTAAFPAGSRVVDWRQSYGSIRTAAGRKYASIEGLDYGDPIAKGLLHQVSGRAPRSTDEIAFTRSLARDTGLRIGDPVRTLDPEGTFRLVGIVADVSYRHTAAAYTLPAAIPPSSRGTYYVAEKWLVDAPGPITWSDVLALNKLGYVALSRTVYLDPPPRSQVHDTPFHQSVSAKAAATGTLVGGMALLEVVLLAGPAFAVSARRQRRDLALVAAVGGRPKDLRNVVLAKGLVLGLAGGLLSVVAATATAAIGIATLGHYVNAIPGHFDVRPLELLTLTVVSLLTALAAAVFPARGAARTDVIAALGGRRGAVRTPKRVPVLGVLLIGVGVLVALGAAGLSVDATVILGGVALTEIGLIVCTPTLLGLVSRAARWLPLSVRIALRDAGRNRSSAAPAIAAVMAAVIGCVAFLIGVASANDQSRRTYNPSLPMNDGFVALGGGTVDPAEVATALRSTLPGARVTAVSYIDSSCGSEPSCNSRSLTPSASAGRAYISGELAPVAVDDGSGVELLLQTRTPEAVAALRAGKAVVTDPTLVHRGLVDAEITTTTSDSPNVDTKAVRLPAVAAGVAAAYTELVLPPSLASRLGLKAHVYGIFADTAHRPTEHERQAADGALAKLDPDLRLSVETGYHNSMLWMMLGLVVSAAVLAVGATMIATALSNVDSRPDLTTLGAVGAAPRTRRLLAMSRAGVIAGIGTLLGAAAGFLPSFAWTHSMASGVPLMYSTSTQKLRLVVPWLPFALVVVVVPLVAVLIAGLFSRSRLPSERPAE